jgi:hypothetical protein
MAISQTSPFARVIADIPTNIALMLDDPAVRGGKTKKQFIADAIVAAVNASATPPAAPKKGKK